MRGKTAETSEPRAGGARMSENIFYFVEYWLKIEKYRAPDHLICYQIICNITKISFFSKRVVSPSGHGLRSKSEGEPPKRARWASEESERIKIFWL